MIFKFQLFSSLILAGLIITIQFIHYPLWLYISKDKLKDFEKSHQKIITPIVSSLMLVEAITAFYLLKTKEPIFIINLALLLGIWASTFFLQVPMHQKILKGIDLDQSIKRLIKTNYIRTFLWVFKGILLSFFV